MTRALACTVVGTAFLTALAAAPVDAGAAPGDRHLNPAGGHALLPGVGRLRQQIVRDPRGRLRVVDLPEGRALGGAALDADVRTSLHAMGVRELARDGSLPTPGAGPGPDVVVPMMVPTEAERRGRNLAWDVDRALDGFTGLRFVRSVPGPVAAEWMHARTGVYRTEDGRTLLAKGNGLSHVMTEPVVRPSHLVDAAGQRRPVGKRLAFSAARLPTGKALIWNPVLGGSTPGDTKVEIERALRLHDAFADAIEGGGPFADDDPRVVRLRALVRTHGIRASQLFPTPRAVLDVTHFPVDSDGETAWVEGQELLGGAARRALASARWGQDDELKVYLYEAPGASRLLQTSAPESIQRVGRGGGTADERTFWAHEFAPFGVTIEPGAGGAVRLDGRPVVTRAERTEARRVVKERIDARFEAVHLVLQLAGMRAGVAAKDAGLGCIYDLKSATHEVAGRSLKSALVNGLGDGYAAGPRRAVTRRAAGWVDRLF